MLKKIALGFAVAVLIGCGTTPMSADNILNTEYTRASAEILSLEIRDREPYKISFSITNTTQNPICVRSNYFDRERTEIRFLDLTFTDGAPIPNLTPIGYTAERFLPFQQIQPSESKNAILIIDRIFKELPPNTTLLRARVRVVGFSCESIDEEFPYFGLELIDSNQMAVDYPEALVIFISEWTYFDEL